ncbi:hypothetical protein L3Q82_008870 [Scortum barcoo]|uniref:Uncharacterized protein n=1 Tax=Scortum barcoo TaxID=214431 RepID=A0ACB8XBK8_9TELE|nr:hypothetical protein L3Q82_008870 [Scortum barcoo]
MLQRRVSQDSPTTSRDLRYSGRISSTPGALPLEELTNYLSDFGLGDGRVHLRDPSLRFLIGRQVGGIEEILEVFLPPSDNVPSSRPTDSPPPWPHRTPPRPEFLPPGPSVWAAALLGLPVPVNCVRSPTGQHGPIGLLLQPDGIPYFRCPPPGSGLPPRQAPETLRPQLRTAASTMEAENMVHSDSMDSMSPASLGICEKLFRRWELKTSLTEGSARRSQQTLTIRLGLPGLSNFLLCQRIQLTTRW